MTDLKRIQAALEFLKDNQGFKAGVLYLAPGENEIAVVGQRLRKKDLIPKPWCK